MLRNSTFIPALLILMCVHFAWPVEAIDLNPPNAATLKQNDAQKLSEAVLKAGSDRSLQNSASTAMQALILFGNKELPKAVSSAYKAYGSFKNSENLDRMEKITILSKAGMQSVDTFKFSKEDVDFLGTRTTFRRLDPAFLSSTEFSKTSAEFEKVTGIRRQDFLQQLSAVSEAEILDNDPKLVEKVIASFESFVAKIPNREFQAKVNKAKALLPGEARQKLLGYAVQEMVKLANRLTPSNISVPEASGSGAQTVAKNDSQKANHQNILAATGEEVAQKGETDGDEFTFPIDLYANQDLVKAAPVPFAHQFDDAIKSAVEMAGDESIFQMVTRKYRVLTLKFNP